MVEIVGHGPSVASKKMVGDLREQWFTVASANCSPTNTTMPRAQAWRCRLGPGTRSEHLRPVHMDWSNTIIASAEDASDMRRRVGAAALDMAVSDGSSQTCWRDIVAARLPSRLGSGAHDVDGPSLAYCD